MEIELEVRVKPGGNRPSADPLSLLQSPGKASVVLAWFQETISPRLSISSSPVLISISPSAQLVPFLCNINFSIEKT